ncbi:hypothetical protein F4225_15360 [Candidatus Poribacteria bacterium]|nr:hypothetical protein [Candidatus Poribacteria bacterium]
MNYGGTTVSLSAGVNMTGPNTAIVVGTSSNWIWSPGITHPTTTDTHDAQMSVNVSDTDDGSVALNNWVFMTYDTLEVTVTKSDLYFAYMSINGESIGNYASGNTSLTLQRSFDSDDAGYHEVVITVNYGSGGQQTTKYTEYVLVLGD